MIRVIQTAKDEQQVWKEKESLELSNDYNSRVDNVRVDSSTVFQTHLGFGGAFTEATAYTYANTTEQNKKELIRAYFNEDEGLAYNLGRTTIGGCDFALEPYVYIEDGDKETDTFNMDRDNKWIIPMIKEAKKEAANPINLMCTPWSPPAFMKENNDVNHGGHLKKEYYESWAKYMTKYILGMKNAGIEISMVSIQNEPEAVQTWASCEVDADEEAVFAVDYLYKELEKAGLGDIKIIIWDHNKDNIYRRVKETLAYKNAKDVVWGVAYHWYVTDKSENLTMVHEAYPDKHLIFTEGCIEVVNTSGATSSKEDIGAWTHGETYGRNIINDFNNYSEGWIDWNLILNEEGGPNYVGNFCEAPITIDRNTDKVYYNMSYYYIGHFSKYIKPGAKRILCRNECLEGIYTVAYLNPNGQIVLVVQSELEESHELALEIDAKGVNVRIPAHSITTYLID